MGGACSTYEEKTKNTYRILVRKPGGKIPLGTPRLSTVDNIKIDLK
jgi:hypothetical protein